MLAVLTLLGFSTLMLAETTKAPLEEDMYLYWRRSDSSQCQPFSTYMLSCNKCVCSADGTSYCTRMACSNKKIVQDETEDNNKHDTYTEQDVSNDIHST